MKIGSLLNLGVTFESLRHRDFRFLFATSFLSASARNLQTISLGWLTYDLTGSGILLGTVIFIYQIPFFIFTIPLGVLTDRVNRKTLLMYSQFSMALVAIALAIDIALGTVEPWHLMVFALISGIENTLIHIVRVVLVPRVVPPESLFNAITVNAMGYFVSRVTAPAIGGFLILFIGVAGNFGIQALLLIAVAFSTMPLRVGRALQDEKTDFTYSGSLVSHTKRSISFIFSNPLIRILFIFQYTISFFALPSFFNFMPIWSTDILKGDAGILGVLYGSIAVGSIIGTLAMARSGKTTFHGLWLIILAILLPIVLILFSQIPSFYVSLSLLVLIGGIQIGFQTITLTRIQTSVPDSLQGTVISLYNLEAGALAFGTLLMGFIVEYSGIQAAFVIMNFPLLFIALVVLVVPSPIKKMR